MAHNNRNNRNRTARRGVTLLLVLGLMTMFAMLVVTFMVVTTQARRTSEIAAKSALDYTGAVNLSHVVSSAKTIPQPNFENALDSLLVGGLDTVIGPHSILENMYGHPDYFKTVAGTTTETKNLAGTVTATESNGLIEAQITFDSGHETGDFGTDVRFFDRLGHVLTVTDGNMANKSLTIVGVDMSALSGFDGTTVTLYLLPRAGGGTASAQAGDITGNTCIINMPAYSGTGPGYDSSATSGARLVGEDDDSMLWALRPNILAPSGNNDLEYKKGLEDNLVLMNPDYTAPDFQNMFLAWSDLEAKSGKYQISTVADSIIPSFHRPYLINYLDQKAGGSGSLALQDLRKAVLRPLRQDHPNFTGSNIADSVSTPADEVNFLIHGPWDVDNDGDGVQDGIWLDLGHEPVQGADGKLYKPLFSFYIIDLDGRLNVNAHGNLEHIGNTAAHDDKKETGSLQDVFGRGAGVAEIRLDLGLMKAVSSITDSDVKSIMNSADTNHPGRYGTDGKPGDGSRDDASWMGGSWTELGYTMGIGYESFALPDSTGNNYGGIVPDFWGAAPLRFDPLGNRYFEATEDYFAENPYLINLYSLVDPGISAGSDDSLFGFNDLEFVIRSVGDVNFYDALYQTSLRYLFGSSADDPDDVDKFSPFRHVVTTWSSDVPVLTRLAGIGGYQGLFAYLKDTICGGNATKTEALITLLPPELLRGEKVSLDRIMLLEANGLTGSALLKQKARFAQEIFYLMLVVCHDKLPTAPTDRAETIARLAQWSVNFVDFLDNDDVMTPLVFTADPLSGATPYDFLETDFDDVYNNNVTNLSSLGGTLIWGMEQPEVALTKTFATQNRRVADSRYGFDIGEDLDDSQAAMRSNKVHKDVTHAQETCDCEVQLNRIATCTCAEPGTPSVPEFMHKHDTTFDQVMIPQGSLFLELYRTGNPNRTYYSKTADTGNLFDADNKLNLSKVQNNMPVWRLAVGKVAKTAPGGTPTYSDQDLFASASADAGNYDFNPHQWPGDPAPTHTGACKVELERFIWFCSQSDATGLPSSAGNCSYFNCGSPASATGTDVLLEPNDYLLIAPRMFTSFKSKEVDERPDAAEDTAKEFGTPDTNENTYIDLNSYFGTGSNASTKLKLMVAAAPSTTFALGGSLGTGIGVSVSEPLPDTTTPGAYYTAPTEPASNEMASKMGVSFSDKYTKQKECNSVEDFNDMVDFEPSFGTISRYKSIFLQRLADPSRAYNEFTNPYITVDWNMIDLHVFNSERDKEGLDDSQDPELTNNVTNGLYFTMRQWGYTASDRSASDRPNIWDRTFNDDVDSDDGGLLPTGDTGSNDLKLRTDMVLGKFANVKLTGYGGEGESGIALSAADLTAKNLTGEYLGAPQVAFVHFPWNNGPLSSTYELMVVPTCSSSRFGFEFHAPSTAQAKEWWKSVKSMGKGDGTNHMPFCNPDSYISPYMNFLYADTDSLELARIFDFVRIPSRFNGTFHTSLITENLSGGGTWSRPVSRMLDPGKINLNTVNEAAWIGFMMETNPGIGYDTLKKSREGSFSTAMPTRFAAPFRSPSAGDLVPSIDINGSTAEDLKIMVRTATEISLLREAEFEEENPSDPDNPTTVNKPLFEPHNPEQSFLGSDKGTNMYTALENVLRRSDLVTCRSNVFAVWITAGYFEVEKFEKSNLGKGDSTDLKHVYSGSDFDLSHVGSNNFDAIYPDGYVLGREKGLDDGSVFRYRRFCIIDRTVPVGFRRGNKDMNHKEVIVRSLSSPD